MPIYKHIKKAFPFTISRGSKAVINWPRFKRSVSLILLFCGMYLPSGAQIIINFNPILNGQTIQGLQQIKIINSTPERVGGSLKINVQDEAGNNVISILTPDFVLHPGVNILHPGIFSNGKISFGNSRAVRVLSETGRFPEGNFQYCFEFDADPIKLDGPVTPYENCYSFDIQPYTPLLLINPLNKAVICNPRPAFTWQPPFPVSRNLRYRIIAATVNPGQQAADAINNNLPVINQAGVTSNLLLYPDNLQSLVQGNTYAWQVTAYINNTIVQKSEIWTFTYDCEKAKPDSVFDSYTEVKNEGSGNYYLANRILKFAVNNPYKAGILDYSIVDLADPFTLISNLPEIPIQNGLNKINLTLDNNKAFINGHTYLMRMNNISNQQVTLRFMYEQKQANNDEQ